MGGMDATVVQAGEVRSARIESVRALAALAVLESHAWGYAHGWYGPAIAGDTGKRVLFGLGSGVLVFFSLSGYLLFWPFVKRWFGTGQPIDLRRYALNRALRILPLYYVAIVVVLLLQEHGGHWFQWWRFLTLTENFSTKTLAYVDQPLWSVIVEIHFYALLPLFAWALAMAAGRRYRRALVLLLVIGAASYIFREWGISTDRGWHTARLLRYNLPGTFFFFIPGMLIAMLRLRWEQGLPRFIRGPLARPSVWFLASLPLWVWHFDSYKDWPAALGSFLIVGACVLPLRQDRAVRALEWRPLAALGIASYSIYAWHMPIVRALSSATGWSYLPLLAIALLAACSVALVSYRFIEAPFLALRKRWSGGRQPAAEQAPHAVGAQAAAVS